MAIKKVVQAQDIISQKTTTNYQSEFMRISMQINDSFNTDDWKKVYKNLVFWELELEQANNNMDEMLQMQKNEANATFVKFIKKNYENWFKENNARPLMVTIYLKQGIPSIDNKKVFCIN